MYGFNFSKHDYYLSVDNYIKLRHLLWIGIIFIILSIALCTKNLRHSLFVLIFSSSDFSFFFNKCTIYLSLQFLLFFALLVRVGRITENTKTKLDVSYI